MKEKDNKQPGWKGMPISFKIFFVLFILNFLLSIGEPIKAFNSGTSFVGFFLFGIFAAFLSFIFLFVGDILRLISLWKRYSWMYKFLLYFESFIIINILLSIINIKSMVNVALSSISQEFLPAGVEQVATIGVIVFLILTAAYHGLFLYFVYKNRELFKREKK